MSSQDPNYPDARVDEERELTTADLANRRPEPDEAELGADEPSEAPAADDESVPLFAQDDAERLRSRWTDIQAGFVDQPREMVEQADQLVADLMQRLAAQFSEERSRLEEQWAREEDVSTEDLRVALKRYRSFFERLLSA
jgi:hypothetical protein